MKPTPKSLDKHATPHLAEWLVALALLAVYFGLAYSGLRATTLTADEGFHLQSGYAYWTEADFRYQSENGNLPQRLGALPLLFFKEKPLLPDTSARVNGNHFDLASQFLWQAGNDPEKMLMAARTTLLCVAGLGLCLAVWACARARWGAAGGLVALFLCAFSPDLLAHGGLVTSDALFALCMLLSLVCLWRMLHRVSPLGAAGCGVVLGLTAVAKFSAPLVAIMALFLWAACLWKNPEVRAGWRGASRALSSRTAKFGAQAGAFALAALVAWGVLWAFYNFRFSGAPAGATHTEYVNPEADLLARCLIANHPELLPTLHSQKDIDAALEKYGAGAVVGIMRKAADWRLLPEAYVHGFLHTYAFSKQRSAFLLGERSNTGWRHYFFVTFGVKSPLALFALMGLGVALWGARLRRACKGRRRAALGDDLYAVAPYLAGIFVYFGAAAATHLNIGHRHILPVYPLLYILLGGVSVYWIRGGARRAALVALLALYAAGALRVCPHFLAYFNPIAGGPAQGYRVLVDSSLDWGQDVPAVAEAMRALRDKGDKSPFYYAHFGSGWPEYYGIEARPLPSYRVSNTVAELGVPPLESGVYFIHATQLQNVYVSAPETWTADIGRLYAQMSAVVQSWQARAHTAEELAALLCTENPYALQFPPQATPQQIQNTLLGKNIELLTQFGNLRFAKLSRFLRAREPDAQIGYSVNVYRLTDADLQAAVGAPAVGLPLPLTDTLARMLGLPRADTRYEK